MERLEYSIEIRAPREHVWQTMLQDATYREWTSAFAEGSHYVGDWSEGSEIRFLAGDSGKGMVARVRECRRPEWVSIEHIGIVDEGAAITSGEQVDDWAGAREEYSLVDLGGSTRVDVSMDCLERDVEMFDSAWPRALEQLRSLAES